MSWLDNFDSALDTSVFGTSVAGDGAVSNSGGSCNITMGAAAANGALVYVKAAIDTTKDFVYTMRHLMDGTVSGYVHLLCLSDGIPACDTFAAQYAKTVLQVYYVQSSGLVYIEYKQVTTGTVYYWNGSNWTTGISGFAIGQAYWLDISLIVKGGSWRISIRKNGDTMSVLETSPIAFSAMKAFTTLYLYWGEPWTDYYYITSMKTDFCQFSNDPVMIAFYNGQVSGTQSIFRALSYDSGIKFHRWDGYNASIAALSGENSVYAPNPIWFDGKIYLFYTAYRNTDAKYRIRLAYSNDLGATFTDVGYMDTVGDAGTWDVGGHGFPVIAYDLASRKWHMYVGGVNVSSVWQIGHFTSGYVGGPWVADPNNPIILVGAGGSWNDSTILPTDIFYQRGEIILYVQGYHSSQYQQGIWRSRDWTNFVADPGNPIFARDATKTTAASSVSAGVTSIPVTSSAPFVQWEIVWIGDGGHREINRILSIPDGTHINLVYPTANAYTTPTVNNLLAGSVSSGSVQDNVAYVTSYFPALLQTEFAARWEYTGSWAYKPGAALSASWDPTKSLPLGLGAGNDKYSSENFKLIHYPNISAMTRRGVMVRPEPLHAYGRRR
jgi:hypothetical protein